MIEMVTEVLIAPDGLELDHPEFRSFAVVVTWRGERTETGRGGYAVTHGSRHLSTAGVWRFNPEPFLQRHYRWVNIEDALEVARAAVNNVKVNGRTWAEWREVWS